MNEENSADGMIISTKKVPACISWSSFSVMVVHKSCRLFIMVSYS